ncbi:MAG TPA: hypothetical protein VFD43_07070 [Planctomycetota bacterium]|nr:hypothetical protein [Planctomycetota bacterium]
MTKAHRAGSCLAVLGAALLAACASGSDAAQTGKPAECLEAEMCDGETTIVLAKAPENREEGQAAADALLAAWLKKNPGANWEQDVRSRHFIAPSHDNAAVLGAGQGGAHPGRDFTERDVLVWKRETERLVAEGARIFHSGDELGSTIAVSCDMCHPDASNTHPETYPKYQTQIGRAVLLRDMINWCLEHPVRAPRMAEDDPRMRAMEAYIYAQRSGTSLSYGKH